MQRGRKKNAPTSTPIPKLYFASDDDSPPVPFAQFRHTERAVKTVALWHSQKKDRMQRLAGVLFNPPSSDE